jgi:hypothetical protein
MGRPQMRIEFNLQDKNRFKINNGNQSWKKFRGNYWEFHKEEGPAVIDKSGYKSWLVNGKFIKSEYPKWKSNLTSPIITGLTSIMVTSIGRRLSITTGYTIKKRARLISINQDINNGISMVIWLKVNTRNENRI